MIKNVFNWFFGSFFRTIGRLLCYILIGFLLSYIISKSGIKLPSLFEPLVVNADTTTEAWLQNINQIERSIWYNWTGSNSLGSSISTSFDSVKVQLYDEHNHYIDGIITNYIYNNNLINVGSNGISFSSNSAQIFQKGYLYRTTTYICSTKALARYSSTSTTIGSEPTAEPLYSFMQMISIRVPKDIKSQIDTDIQYCYAVNGVIIPDETAYNVWSRITGTTNTRIYLFGYNNVVLGYGNNLSVSDVENIVNNSGLATASDIEAVNDAIDNMTDEITAQTEQQQQNHEETINTLTDDDTSEASNSASNFFNNFNTNNHGLTGIITAPLSAIQSLTSKSCTNLVLPLPFVDENLTLPCMRNIYTQYFGDFMQIYDTITLGIISYWVMVRIFSLVKDFKNPEHDEIEVVDL